MPSPPRSAASSRVSKQPAEQLLLGLLSSSLASLSSPPLFELIHLALGYNNTQPTKTQPDTSVGYDNELTSQLLTSCPLENLPSVIGS